ncbi:MAG: glycyl-radical enzyme activating protein [Clostridium sp.]|uniref:glycyl-radical enzyme activating protein n=1 Tax=Clostridium sp. TaxID=1506 RepID=UPI0025C660C0|nr:glycyl-radical enzyme activating protein [Clostridium sp.]MCH3964940.1 glycyl-radical enzyme activating protein [Clostridium sp.]MCI1716566.1 glycyl-radical enzyme activating protein [Clostridium sp.]MCI1800952.1 glycyl-radical enzyme activating protein [Clostridium sp.]MCI1814743.1 glycyl-radical enzyme activating protein [Clostridium sp.]MCI1871699.1 glycyl-radical enzyme activating protein [Clostridium sp.]
MKDIKACIFNIQKYSIHDGPGIRTVVFFKGCPLRCIWCSNPESQNREIEISHNRSSCIKCLKCIHCCNKNAIYLENDTIKIDNKKCVSCFDCINICPKNALKKEGSHLTLDYVFKEVLKDKVFYEESNGGVTLSGGEVLLQHEFASELLKLLRSENIHTAIETEGYAPNKIFSKFIDNVDLLLFDIKHYDRQKHFKATAVYNDIILENLQTALNRKKDIIIRIPVIPGINSDLENAANFCNLFRTLGVSRINLLPFHQFGQNKYEMLGRNYKLKDIPPLHEEDLMEYKKIFIRNGFDCWF